MEKKFKCMICSKVYDFNKDKRPIVEVKNLDGSIGVYDGCCKPGSLIEIEKQSMESKYYTPEISEFHVGFEFEVNYSIGVGWIKDCIYNCSTNIEKAWLNVKTLPFMKTENIRVKYLDKEDIESLGFTQSGLNENVYNSKEQIDFQGRGEKVTIGINYSEGHTHIIVFLVPDPLAVIAGVNLFVGNIKNKSELKRLLTQLNIT